MTTNAERKARIKQLQDNLEVEIWELKKNCRQEVARIEREIKECGAQEIREARAEILAILQQRGLTAADVLTNARKVTKESTTMHTGPNGEQWGGRGRVPNWYKEQQKNSDNSADTRH
jgi:hypothetical protein